MKIVSVEITGFRGFCQKQTFDMDADAIIIVGANGNGKTCLFDAVLWGLCGRVPRLGADDAKILNKFSETGQAKVVLCLHDQEAGSSLIITRSFDGTDTRLSCEVGGEILRGPEAEGRLIRSLWKDAASATNPSEAFATMLTRSLYLQQDLVRNFIDAASDSERFAAVSELVGAGRITEFQGELERAKKAWSTATNNRTAEIEPLRIRLAAMEARLKELKGRVVLNDRGIEEAEWTNWRKQVGSLGVEVKDLDIESMEVAAAIDTAIRMLAVNSQAASRKEQLLDAIASEMRIFVTKPKPELHSLQETVALQRKQVQSTRELVAAEQLRAAEYRRAQSELKERTEQLRALAETALKHLGEKCPVCEQDYDIEATRTRLEAIVAGGTRSADGIKQDLLPQLLSRLGSEEKTLSSTELALGTAEQASREYEAMKQGIERRIADVGIVAPISLDGIQALSTSAEATRAILSELAKVQKSGEQLAFKLAQAGDQSLIRDLEKEIATSRSIVQQEEYVLKSRAATGEKAQKVIEALRESASRVVTERVEEIVPILSDMYSRIDVHPAFRVIRFLTSIVRGRGQLATRLSDPVTNVDCDLPGVILSSSQMNALAVCTFLSLNLAVARLPLRTAILDDPLQSLDDINLLGLVDLLRQAKSQRQLFISTHDAHFGDLLARKLRPNSPETRTLVIEFRNWSRSGPQVATRDILSDPVPLRLIASG